MTSLDPIPSSRNDEHFSYPFREPSLYGGATSQSREGLLQALLNFPNTDKLPGLLDQFICGPGTQGQRPACDKWFFIAVSVHRNLGFSEPSARLQRGIILFLGKSLSGDRKLKLAISWSRAVGDPSL